MTIDITRTTLDELNAMPSDTFVDTLSAPRTRGKGGGSR
jgi:hypothetical protein